MAIGPGARMDPNGVFMYLLHHTDCQGRTYFGGMSKSACSLPGCFNAPAGLSWAASSGQSASLVGCNVIAAMSMHFALPQAVRCLKRRAQKEHASAPACLSNQTNDQPDPRGLLQRRASGRSQERKSSPGGIHCGAFQSQDSPDACLQESAMLHDKMFLLEAEIIKTDLMMLVSSQASNVACQRLSGLQERLHSSMKGKLPGVSRDQLSHSQADKKASL